MSETRIDAAPDAEWLAWIATTLYEPENRERCKRIADTLAAEASDAENLAEQLRSLIPLAWAASTGSGDDARVKGADDVLAAFDARRADQ